MFHSTLAGDAIVLQSTIFMLFSLIMSILQINTAFESLIFKGCSDTGSVHFCIKFPGLYNQKFLPVGRMLSVHSSFRSQHAFIGQCAIINCTENSKDKCHSWGTIKKSLRS